MKEKAVRLETPFQVHMSFIDGVHEIVSSGRFLATGSVGMTGGRGSVFGITLIGRETESAAYVGLVDPVSGIITFDTAHVTWKGRLSLKNAQPYIGLMMWELSHAFDQVMSKLKRKRWSPR